MGDLVCSHAECSTGDPVLVLTSAAIALDASALRFHQQEGGLLRYDVVSALVHPVSRRFSEFPLPLGPALLPGAGFSGVRKGGLPRPKALSLSVVAGYSRHLATLGGRRSVSVSRIPAHCDIHQHRNASKPCAPRRLIRSDRTGFATRPHRRKLQSRITALSFSPKVTLGRLVHLARIRFYVGPWTSTKAALVAKLRCISTATAARWCCTVACSLSNRTGSGTLRRHLEAVLKDEVIQPFCSAAIHAATLPAGPTITVMQARWLHNWTQRVRRGTTRRCPVSFAAAVRRGEMESNHRPPDYQPGALYCRRHWLDHCGRAFPLPSCQCAAGSSCCGCTRGTPTELSPH